MNQESETPTPSSPPDAPNVDGPSEVTNAKLLEGRSFGGILLYQRGEIFEKIHQSTNLERMISYFLLWSVLFSAAFGAVLGVFSYDLQIFAGAIKSPFLLWGTLGICLPALFTFNVLLGSKLSFKQTTAVLAMTTYLIATVLVSLCPIVLFFIICGSSESFIILLTVISMTISGTFGVSLLWQAMMYLTKRVGSTYNHAIIKSWTIIYMFVGTQFAWVIRPWVGTHGQFAWLRELGGNFYSGLLQVVSSILN
jgi:hypothetical protein